MTLSKQRKFTFNCLFEDIKGSLCCVIKVRQYIKSDEIWYLFILFVFLIINIDRCLLTKSVFPLKYLFFFCYLIRCLSQHKLKFWTGLRQKIRCGMVLVGMDSKE